MELKVILNKCHPLSGFVYRNIKFVNDEIQVNITARKNSRGICSSCEKKAPTYDTSRVARSFEFIPILGFVVFFIYSMRRVHCPNCGIVTEKVPWADGKNRCCNAYRLFLSRWARRLPWSEVALIFGTTWNVVYRSVNWVVQYGLQKRTLDNIKSIGVDEVAIWKGHKYLTVVYQIDEGRRRLIWIGKERTEETLVGFFDMLGQKRMQAIEFVASDMWKPYLKVIRQKLSHALHVLDRFHIVAKLNKAIDQVRAQEARQLRQDGYEPILKSSRWCFLKRSENLTDKQKVKLKDVLQYNLRSVRAYLLKESFDAFWTYNSPYWAGWFLDRWCNRAMKSRIAPIKKFVKTLRKHRELLMNYFKAKKEISSGVVEGLNTNVKLALRKARGYKSYEVAKTALYHELGRLPEPEFTHRFC